MLQQDGLRSGAKLQGSEEGRRPASVDELLKVMYVATLIVGL
jgi:hypothetical protein